MLCNSCHFIPLKPLTLRMDNAKLLDVLTSLPVSHAILPHACVLQRHFQQTMQYVVNDNVNNVKLSYDVIFYVTLFNAAIFISPVFRTHWRYWLKRQKGLYYADVIKRL